jgi:RNA polymerase sigma factor FliA
MTTATTSASGTAATTTGADARPDLDGVWADYKAHGDRADRDALIVAYSPLVKYVASRVASGLPQSVDQADLVSYGIFGLIDAIEKFDLERGYKFETYAMARIKGAILDELRSIDWVPRSVRAKARTMERAFSKLESELHRAPTDAEVAAEMGISDDQFQQLLSRLSIAGVAALDEVMGTAERGETTTLADTIPDREDGPVAALERSETRRMVAEIVTNLPEREKTVLSLYYYENLTLAEIGRILGVTESRVCQIHTKAVVHVRARLAAAERD